MAPAIATEIRTLADLLVQLGDIPPDRVRFHPYPGTATKADLIAFDAQGGKFVELIDGVFVEKAMGFKEGMIALTIGAILRGFVRPLKLGVIVGADATVELRDQLVRIPDVAFVSWDRMPSGVPDDPIPDLAPNLAVEVLSRTNTPTEMQRKRAEYFQAGVQLVWMVHPSTRTVQVYESVEDFVELTSDDVITGGDVLPGFECRVSEFFADLAPTDADNSDS